MDTPNPRPDLIVGNRCEYLAIAAGKVNGIPVAILTFRPRPTAPQPLNLMISRAALLRMREDIDFLLAHSAFLKGGESPEISLAEVEAIGLESPGTTGLDGMELRCNWKKKQQDRYLQAIDRIQSAGITVNGCFILGLDGQTTAVFDEIVKFVEQSRLFEVQVTLQTPFPGTPLFERLQRDGRLFSDRFWEKCTLFDLTHQPSGMSPGELRSGLIWICQSLYNDAAIHRRKQPFHEQFQKHRVE